MAPALTLTPIRRHFARPAAVDVERCVAEGVRRACAGVAAGAPVAIAVGSRGISDLPRVVSCVVAALRELGAEPFVVPAMGSHGGATAVGQAELLADYGVTERAVGAPVRSSMDTVELAAPGVGCRLFMDRLVFESAGAVLVNRIKPHTDFHGRYESGLAKMAVVGLGKQRQALEVHRFGAAGLRRLIAPAAKVVLASGKVLAGVAVVEDAGEQIARVEVLSAADILPREPQLLRLARRYMPTLPVDDIDVLVVDRLGKDVSGTGMDPNIIGRMRIAGEPEPQQPRIKAIVVDDITPASHGNALGVGLADVITARLHGKIDFAAMYENVFASTFLERAKIPVVAQTAARALEFALRCCGPVETGRERIVRIRDTSHLGEAQVSQALLAELHGRSDIEVSGVAAELLDERGGLRSAWGATNG